MSDLVTVPQQAVTRGTNADTVMVVSADGKVAPRQIKVGSASNGQWVVLDGLKPHAPSELPGRPLDFADLERARRRNLR